MKAKKSPNDRCANCDHKRCEHMKYGCLFVCKGFSGKKVVCECGRFLGPRRRARKAKR